MSREHRAARQISNKTRTKSTAFSEDGKRLCSYIAAETWRSGAAPFCAAPALPGSSYCAVHAALCAVDPLSERGERLAAEQDDAAASVPTRPLAELAACPVPELLEEEGALDLWDLPFKITNEPEGQ